MERAGIEIRYPAPFVTLQPGTRLGPYEIAEPLGAGGMGEVYRGRDTRLDRSVAIKVLPAEYAANAQLRARLEREARAISSLNHPNVCTLYDVGSQNGTDYLVMELIEGETLADRIARGRLPLAEALKHAIEIAGALDKAHRHGIIHRDLKPGNVMLTRTGAKLLDFGLSKPAPLTQIVSPDSATRQMTEKPLTAEGTIVGTFQYMAPEQIEGRDADARTDLFAFGALLYEMLTGRRAFDGKTRTSMIAQILEREPPPVSEVLPMTPRPVDRVVRACLAKDPDDRFQTAHDVLLELRWIQEELSSPQAAVQRPRKALNLLPWALLALAAIAIAWLFATRRATLQQQPRPVRASIVPAPKTHFATSGDFAGAVALAPDGTQVAWVAIDEEGRRYVWVRPLDSTDARRLDATLNATFPFWSPDGKSIGFFADGLMKTVDAAGGAAQTVCSATDPRGGTWNEQGEIVFAPLTRDGLYRVRAAGGDPQPVTKLSAAHSTHRWPVFLPDGKRFIYLAANHGQPRSADTALYLGSLDGKENRLLVHTFGNGALAAGHLLYVRDSTLVARPFDIEAAAFTGEPVPVARGVTLDLSTWRAIFDTAGADTLVYQSGTADLNARLIMYDATGKVLRQLSTVAAYGDLVPSPDGKRLVTNIGDPQSNHWVVDVETGARTRITFDRGFERTASWSADGTELFYSSASGTRYSCLYRKPIGGRPRTLIACDPKADLLGGGVTRDKQWVLAVRQEPQTKPSIVVYPAAGGTPRTLIESDPHPVFTATLAPQGDLVSYGALEDTGGRVYVATFPDADAKWQVSSNVAHKPVWSTDGNTLYFLTQQDELAAVAVNRGPDGVSFGPERVLFRIPSLHPAPGQPYAVLPDGRVVATTTETGSEPLTLFTNWSSTLRQNVPR